MQGMGTFTMPGETNSGILVVSRSAALVEVVDSSLRESGIAVRGAASIEDALTAICAPPPLSAALLDVEWGTTALEQLLAAVTAATEFHLFPVLLVCDEDQPPWRDRLAHGVIDDLVPRTMPPCQWRVRFEVALRSFRHTQECRRSRQCPTAMDLGIDPLTGLFTRKPFLSMFFRETDRVQRMNTSLSLMMFEIDNFAGLQQRLGVSAWNDLLKQAVMRVQRLLRSYDVFARLGAAAFAICLPGCTAMNAVSLAGRLQTEVFTPPFVTGTSTVRLTAGCGIAPSHGRSPLVVLREAEEALASAKATRPGAICSSRDPHPIHPPQDFLHLARQ